MKIIISEEQYKLLENHTKNYDNAKKILFKIWQRELDSNGEIDFDAKIGNYLDYKSIGQIHEMYRDFLGGWDKMVEKTFELMNTTFDTNDYDFSGGYDFRFKVLGYSDYEEDNILYVDCPIESDGKVDLIMTDGGTHLLKDVEYNEDLWWEVESEISSLIEDILYKEVTKKTGILIDVNMLWIKE